MSEAQAGEAAHRRGPRRAPSRPAPVTGCSRPPCRAPWPPPRAAPPPPPPPPRRAAAATPPRRRPGTTARWTGSGWARRAEKRHVSGRCRCECAGGGLQGWTASTLKDCSTDRLGLEVGRREDMRGSKSMEWRSGRKQQPTWRVPQPRRSSDARPFTWHMWRSAGCAPCRATSLARAQSCRSARQTQRRWAVAQTRRRTTAYTWSAAQRGEIGDGGTRRAPRAVARNEPAPTHRLPACACPEPLR